MMAMKALQRRKGNDLKSKVCLMFDQLIFVLQLISLQKRFLNQVCKREVTSLITFSGGFICSYGSNSVYIVEQQPAPGEEIKFRGTKKIVFPPRIIKKSGVDGYMVKSLCVSPSEDLLIALTDDLLLYSYQLKKKEGAQVRLEVKQKIFPQIHFSLG